MEDKAVLYGSRRRMIFTTDQTLCCLPNDGGWERPLRKRTTLSTRHVKATKTWSGKGRAYERRSKSLREDFEKPTRRLREEFEKPIKLFEL
eukprot:5571226-Amphidinium_carterae.2